MVCFQTQNPNLVKFWRALNWKKFKYYMAIWNILWTFGVFYNHLVHFSGFGIVYQEKSGNPAVESKEGGKEKMGHLCQRLNGPSSRTEYKKVA
jgi:hypothetical protein